MDKPHARSSSSLPAYKKIRVVVGLTWHGTNTKQRAWPDGITRARALLGYRYGIQSE